MKKRILSILLCIILLFSSVSVFAENAGKTEVFNTYSLSLSEAIAMAQENSRQMKVLDGSEKASEHSLTLAKQDRSKVEGVKVKMPLGINTVLMQSGYFVAQQESTLRLVKSEMHQAKASIAYSVSEKYYNCVLMQSFLNSAKETYNLAHENKNKVDTMLSLGMITQIEADNAALSVLQAKLNTENYERQLELAFDALKSSLELSDEDYKNANIILTDDIVYGEFSADVSADTELAKVQRYDMLNLKENYELVKQYAELTARHLGSKSATYTEAKENLANLEYNYSNAQKQMGILIKSLYNNVLSAKGNITIAKEALSVAKSQYEAAKLRFELGLITNIELTDQLNKMHEKEVALLQSEINYILAVEKYKYEVEIGL